MAPTVMPMEGRPRTSPYFARESTTAETVEEGMAKYGEVRGRPSIGITVGAIPDNASDQYQLPSGLYISAVAPGSDAEKKGIRAGDIVIAVNSAPVTSTDEVLTVKNQLQVGDTMTFTIWREGDTFDVDVVMVDTNDVY